MGSQKSANTIAITEIYDPSVDQWTTTASMATPRGFHAATLLNSGQVLATGGTTFNINGIINSCEIYDPSTSQ
ncbi:unnamed protein product, partial [Rotaria sp. Silwood2]